MERETLLELKEEIARLKGALDAANRECAALKAENDRLHKENIWLTREGEVECSIPACLPVRLTIGKPRKTFSTD